MSPIGTSITLAAQGTDAKKLKFKNKIRLNGIQDAEFLTVYFHWLFRVNFIFLFVIFTVGYFAWTVFFAGLITIAGRVEPECIRIGGAEFDSTGNAFADAFQLSWTTISTVGYGSSNPALGYQNDRPMKCFWASLLCSIEALVGILFCSFCGAILFGKILRIQSRAQVKFSDPILIRYGKGVSHAKVSDTEKGLEDDVVPFPVLEFRVVNMLSGIVGGEIIDSTLNVVANLNTPDDLDNSVHGSVTGSQSKSLESKRSVMSQSPSDGESVSLRLAGKHVFSKVYLESQEHPYFKRVWVARHTLDANSPLVKPRVKRAITANNGHWPERMNNASAIRDSIKFNQILVSLNGVTNFSASDVYAQKIYDFIDVHVGYKFLNMLYRDHNQDLAVDFDLLNDVVEQDGGGAEPIVVQC